MSGCYPKKIKLSIYRMLRTILSVSGKAGLFRLLSQGKGNLIVESLTDAKRMPIHAKDRVVSLGDITMYTTAEDMPLGDVLTAVYARHEGKAIDLASLSTREELFESFAGCVANFDRERVYPSDIKKLYSWYNILIAAGFTSFVGEDETTAE